MTLSIDVIGLRLIKGVAANSLRLPFKHQDEHQSDDLRGLRVVADPLDAAGPREEFVNVLVKEGLFDLRGARVRVVLNHSRDQTLYLFDNVL